MLPLKERLEKLNELQLITVEQIKQGWEQQNELICVRPTGFGKTFTAGRIIRERNSKNEYKYKNVAFISPGDTTMIQFNNELLYEGTDKEPIICAIYRNGKLDYKHPKWTKKNGITIYEVTYALIARRFGDREDITKEEAEQVFGPKLDLAILDELHHAGGKKTLMGLLFTLQTHYSDVKKLGITATYSRADNVDVGYELFGSDCLIPEYTYAEAVEDGVLPNIEYFCNDYAIMKATQAEYRRLSAAAKTNPVLDKELKRVTKSFTDCLSNISETIRSDTLNVIGAEADYSQKWLVFYPKRDSLLENYKTIEKWYRDAFPDHNVQSIVVLDTPEFRGNREKVCRYGVHEYNPPKDAKVITLIFSVGMLLEAVHLDNVTGLLLFTNTTSVLKYQQTLGRVIDSKRETTPLVIDMMDGYDTLYQRLIDDIKDAKDVLSGNPEQHSGEKKERTDKEEKSYLTKLTVHSHKLDHRAFLSNMLKIQGLTQLRRRAMEIMNGIISFAGAYKISGIHPDFLIEEIKEINRTSSLERTKVVLENLHKELEAAIRTNPTGMIDPLTGYNFVEAVFADNSQLTAEEYTAIMTEYKQVLESLKRAKK